MIRKWIYKLRYILIILSALLWLLGLSNSFWYEIFQDCYSNNWYSNNQCWDITDEFFQYRNWYNKIDTNFNFIYQSTDDYNVFYLQEDWIFLYWWEDHKLHYKWDQFSWLIWNVCVVWSDNINDIWSRCGYAVGWESINWCWANYNEDNSIFYNTNWNFDKVYFLPWYIDWLYNNWWGWVICWVKWKGAVCFALNQIWSAWSTCWFFTWYSQDINIKDYWLSELSSYFWSSPFNGAWGGWTNINVWEDLTNWQVSNALSSYWFSKNICYWGLSASSDYSSSIPWTWKTIFQIYNEFNPNSISNIVDWYAYYKNWYNDYPYFSFSWWTYITDSHSPFLVNWNFYLSAFRLFQYWEYYGVGFYPASDIVEYCDLLLNKNPDSLYTWDDWSSIVDNSSVIDYWSAIYRALSWDMQLLYSWDISKLSWENLNFDSQSFFSNLTTKFAWLNNSDENLFQVVWVIPSYILVFMFALILIRMISK